MDNIVLVFRKKFECVLQVGHKIYKYTRLCGAICGNCSFHDTQEALSDSLQCSWNYYHFELQFDFHNSL